MSNPDPRLTFNKEIMFIFVMKNIPVKSYILENCCRITYLKSNHEGMLSKQIKRDYQLSFVTAASLTYQLKLSHFSLLS